MPTFRHNLVIELFRNSGELAREMLSELVALPPGDFIAEALPTDLSQLVPTEYRADHVTAYHHKGGRGGPPAFAIIIEVQHRIDERKRWSWLSYVANAATSFQCPVMLLVVTWNPRVAAWARGPFSTGQPGFDLCPFAIDLSKLPKLLSPDVARRIPELAVLCALAHPNAASVKAAIPTLRGLPPDRAALYWKSITNALATSEVLSMEQQMIEAPEVAHFLKTFPRLCDHLLKILEKKKREEERRKGRREGRREGLQEGRREGLQKGRRKGLQEGKLAGLRAAALELLRAKLGKVSAAEEATIREVQGAHVLTALLVELGTADRAGKARTAIAHARRAAR